MMQSKKDANHFIPEIIVVDDVRTFPPRALTNRRRSSRRKVSKDNSSQSNKSLLTSLPNLIDFFAKDSTNSMTDQPNSLDTTRFEPIYKESIVALVPDDDLGEKVRPKRKSGRAARRASIDLGMLPSQSEDHVYSLYGLEQRPVRRKSIDHVRPIVLPWSFDHNTDSSEESSVDCVDNPEDVVFVGVAGVSKRELMDAMLGATSATLDSSLSQLNYASSAHELSTVKQFMEPLLSLSDLCGTLIPPRIVVDKTRHHPNKRMSRHGNSFDSNSLVEAVEMARRSVSESVLKVEF